MHHHRADHEIRSAPWRGAQAVCCFCATGQKIVAIVLLFFAVSALAQTRVIEHYIYDAAGNIVGIESVVIDGPPLIDSITPDRLFAGSRRAFEITGQNLLGADIESVLPGVSVESLESAPASLRFDLSASEDVAIGTADLLVTTLSGTDSTEITVRPRLPELIAQPLPLVVGADGGEGMLQITLLEPASTDWVLDVEIADPAIASTSTTQIQLDPGQVALPEGITVVGAETGSTVLRIAVEGVTLLEISVFSTSFGELPAGNWRFESAVVGVRKERSVRLIERGPLVDTLGVARSAADTGPAVLDADVASARLGVARGPVLFDVAPETISREEGSATLLLNGAGLAEVEGVRIVSPDGMAVESFDVAGDGGSVSVQLLIDPDAQLGIRRVVAETLSGPIASMDPAADRFYLAGELPQIESITPSSVELGELFRMTVRGRNFSPTSQLIVSPGDGIVIDSPISISADQTTIDADIQVADAAAVGARLVQVQTAAGASSPSASGANTLQISEPGLVRFSPVLSSGLGVHRGVGDPQFDAMAVSPGLGVARGRILSELEPRVFEADSQPVILGLGAGLDAISSVEIEPADDVAVTGLVTMPEAIEFSLEIAPSAALGVRAIRFFTADGELPVARPELRTLRIVASQPVVEGLSPVYLEPGTGPVEIAVRGANLQNAESVSVIPQADLQLGTFSVAPGGDEIRLMMSADAGAATGARVVQVTTPAGASATVMASGNRLYIGDPESRLITPLVASRTGVIREPAPETIDLQSFSNLLGIERPGPAGPAEVEVAVTGGSRQILRGKAMLEIRPSVVPQGFVGDVVVSGLGLGLDIEVMLENGEGIALTGPPVVELDDDDEPFVRVPLSVAEDAPITRHRMRIAEPNGGGGASIEIPFLDPAQSQLRVAGPSPVIQSIAPIITLSGETFALLIRGFNLGEAVEVRVIPDQGVSVGSQLDINADGTELSVNVDVTADAEPGPRLIQVVAPAGDSGDVANAANTLTVVEP